MMCEEGECSLLGSGQPLPLLSVLQVPIQQAQSNPEGWQRVQKTTRAAGEAPLLQEGLLSRADAGNPIPGQLVLCCRSWDRSWAGPR